MIPIGGNSLKSLPWDEKEDPSATEKLLSSTIHEWHKLRHQSASEDELEFINQIPVSACPYCGADKMFLPARIAEQTRSSKRDSGTEFKSTNAKCATENSMHSQIQSLKIERSLFKNGLNIFSISLNITLFTLVHVITETQKAQEDTGFIRCLQF